MGSRYTERSQNGGRFREVRRDLAKLSRNDDVYSKLGKSGEVRSDVGEVPD
jgi:hypothetical protein